MIACPGSQGGGDASLEWNTDARLDLKTGTALQFNTKSSSAPSTDACPKQVLLCFCKCTFGIKLNGSTVALIDAPGTVEDRSALGNVELRCVGLGSSDHHAGAANKANRDKW